MKTWDTLCRARWWSGIPPWGVLGTHRMVNMAASTSGGRRENGESVLRRSFNAWMDSSNASILASMACCNSREISWLGIIKQCYPHRKEVRYGKADRTAPCFSHENILTLGVEDNVLDSFAAPHIVTLYLVASLAAATPYFAPQIKPRRYIAHMIRWIVFFNVNFNLFCLSNLPF